MTLRTTRLGLLVDHAAVAARHRAGRHAFGLHLAELLDHQRIAYQQITRADLDDCATVIVAQADPDPGMLAALTAWVEAGGTCILTATAPGWDTLGTPVADARGTGLVAFGDHPAWTQRPPRPLRAIGGHALTPTPRTDVLAAWDDGAAAITRADVGAGQVVTFGADLPRTVVRLRQGYPVHEDGTPSRDGTVPMDDDILKCEDGLGLDVDADRAMPPGAPPTPQPYPYGYPPPAPTPLFDLPQADLWWVALAQLLWWLDERAGRASAWLHYWPAGVPAMAHLSHDADLNQTEDAEAALEAFSEAGVSVTWCQVYPGGYDPAIYRRVTEAGHEQALHYNAMGDGDIASWGWPQFRAQYAWAQAVTGTDAIVANKNHYTRWEGFTEFYTWCERVGIKIDESRGPSKIGDVGFTFGASHLSFPMGDVTEQNRPMDVLSLPLHTQDLAWAGDLSCRDVILDGAELVHGVAHFLFHGPHLRQRPATRAACPELVALARERGLRWWPAGRLNAWERARRGVDLSVRTEDDDVIIAAESAETLEEAGVLIMVPGARAGDLVCDDPDVTMADVRRHGRSFVELTVSLQPGHHEWRLRRPVTEQRSDE